MQSDDTFMETAKTQGTALNTLLCKHKLSLTNRRSLFISRWDSNEAYPQDANLTLLGKIYFP
jgi:hypothetical protein